eukprot:g56071.t1
MGACLSCLRNGEAAERADRQIALLSPEDRASGSGANAGQPPPVSSQTPYDQGEYSREAHIGDGQDAFWMMIMGRVPEQREQDASPRGVPNLNFQETLRGPRGNGGYEQKEAKDAKTTRLISQSHLHSSSNTGIITNSTVATNAEQRTAVRIRAFAPRAFWRRSADTRPHAVIVGLENVGKTTLLKVYKERLQLESIPETLSTVLYNPTVLYNREEIAVKVNTLKTRQLVIWDMAGSKNMRALWRHFSKNVQGIIFVVNSTDSAHLDNAKRALYSMLKLRQLWGPGVPLLVMANKQDLKGAMTAEQIVHHFGLAFTDKRRWCVVATSVKTGRGVRDGLKWLAEQMPDGNR